MVLQDESDEEDISDYCETDLEDISDEFYLGEELDQAEFYKDVCSELGIVPAKIYLLNFGGKEMILSHHGLGPKVMQPPSP